ncbi:SDR family oxidoreductase [Streptomyces flaveolus]|uniref:SDR family oxidoreductase n=1 Tax=Streptomyces flaveolus TaxID=67297 RepID=UPI003332B1F6
MLTPVIRRPIVAPAWRCAPLTAYPPDVYRTLFHIDTTGNDVLGGDVRDAVSMQRAMRRADYGVHAAALADVPSCTRRPQDAIDHNITGTQTVLSAAAASDRLKQLVFVPSASVYGNGNPADWTGPCGNHRTTRDSLAAVYGRTVPCFTEHAPLRPLSVYANTKALGEAQTALQLGAVGTWWCAASPCTRCPRQSSSARARRSAASAKSSAIS